jgi:DNA-binding MarR family transcriptional regulator
MSAKPYDEIPSLMPDHVETLRENWARELPLVDTIGMAILGRARRIVSLSRPGIEEILHSFGLNAGEFDVLATLRRSGHPYTMRPTEIYKSLMISSGGLTDRLDRLERGKMLMRIADKDDGRSSLVALSAAGITCVEKAFAADMEFEQSLLSCLSKQDCDMLGMLLQNLALDIEQR